VKATQHNTHDVVTSDLEKIIALVDRARIASPVWRELLHRDVVRAVTRFEAQHGDDPIELILEATS
jgi:hypothetical protein